MQQDGRWGFWVVAATAFSSALWTSEMRCFPAFYHPLISEFNVNYGSVSFLMGLFEIGYGISCVSVPVLFKYVDYRPVVIGAGFLSSFFIFLASFANALWQVQVCCGFIPGLCMGGIIVGVYTSVARYFNKYRVLAMQVGNAGASLGALALCPLYQLFINAYAWRGAWQLVAGVFLNVAVAGALLRPIDIPEDDKIGTLKAQSKELTPRAVFETDNIEENESIQFVIPDQENEERKSTWFVDLAKKWDLNLFITFDFYLYVLGWISIAAAYHNALGYLVPFGKSIGFDSIQASTLPSSFAVGEILSRIFHAFVFIKVPKGLQYPVVAGALAVSSLFYFTLPFTASFIPVLILCGLIGLCIGGVDALYCVILVELFNLDRYASSYGYSNIFSHLIGMAVTIFIGHAIDLSGTVSTAFWIGGGSLLLACGFLLLIDRRIKQKNVER